MLRLAGEFHSKPTSVNRQHAVVIENPHFLYRPLVPSVRKTLEDSVDIRQSVPQSLAERLIAPFVPLALTHGSKLPPE